MANEREMMIEIKNNGPIVVNFRVDLAFSFYKDGVYSHA